MKIRIFISALVLSTLIWAQARVVQAFEDKNLGHGYQLKWRHVDLTNCPSCPEGTAHYTDLYWKDKRIGEYVGAHFISPSGQYALFEQVGKLMLFSMTSKKTADVTEGVFAVPQSVAWDEKQNVATVTYYDKHKPSSIRLGSN